MISIVMPCRNARGYVREAIASVRAQTVPNWRLVIVDSVSTDGTADILAAEAARDPRVQVVEQENRGASAGRNIGIDRIGDEARYVAFLDADDLWEPDALAVLLGALESDPGAVGAHGLARLVNSDGSPLPDGDPEKWMPPRRTVADGRVVQLPDTAPTTFNVLAMDNCIAVGSILLRRAVVHTPFFANDVVYLEDWQSWLRVCAEGHLAFVNRVVLNYRRHGGNASANQRGMFDSQTAIRRQLVRDPGLPPQLRETALIASQYAHRERYQRECQWRLQFARDCAREGHLIEAAKQLRHAARSLAIRARGFRL